MLLLLNAEGYSVVSAYSQMTESKQCILCGEDFRNSESKHHLPSDLLTHHSLHYS